MVAKSFQGMTLLCEPYENNKKMYVKIRNEKTGTERVVRWYTESEYIKMYPEEKDKIVVTTKVNPQKEVLGFTKGYITIFKGNIEDNLEWFENSIARYCRWWGWYIISTDEIPADLPQGIEAIKLDWEKVGESNGLLKSETFITQYIENLTYGENKSDYVGSIGERLDIVVTVTTSETTAAFRGTSTFHVFQDDKGNAFSWTTSAKTWEVGEKKHIRGTIKSHEVIKGIKTTVLTRCVEV
jgi:hypothetical protein